MVLPIDVELFVFVGQPGWMGYLNMNHRGVVIHLNLMLWVERRFGIISKIDDCQVFLSEVNRKVDIIKVRI